jgi:hypothetical protein
MAISAIPKEILYWSRFLSRILTIELTFWLLFLVAALLSWLLSLPVMAVLGVVALCVVVRLAFYVSLGARMDIASHASSGQN